MTDGARANAGWRPSQRSGIAPFVVMEVLAAAQRRAATGAAVVHLEIGEPGGGAPAAVRAAAARALDAAELGYTGALGLAELRAAIARHYRVRYGLEVPAERIAITAGASGAFVLAFLAAFDAGSRVVVSEPGYPAYRNILQALDIVPEAVPVGPAEGYRLTAAMVAALEPPPAGVVVASPANPTGVVDSAAELEALAAVCRRRGIRLIADEIYHGITYGTPASSVLAYDPSALVVNSFSKYFCMTGWRLGWMVVPEDLLGAVTRLAQNLFIAPSTIAQHAALAAFDAYAELDARVAAYRRSRDRLLAALAAGGIEEIAPAEGAFYLYARTDRHDADSASLCRALLEETGIALTPGSDFDRRRGHAYARLSFCGAEAEVAAAAERLGGWLRARR
jgi:aspartate/methionine/tyrosine aminotransferase